MIIVLVLVIGAVLGWFGCYVIKVLDWKEAAFASFYMAQSYAMCFFQSNAKKDCEECRGRGFLEGKFVLEPCKICFAEPTEVEVNGIRVKVNHGRLREAKITPKGNSNISGPGSSQEGKQ